MRYFWFADRFGWTPTQVDAQPAPLLRRLMLVGEVRDEVIYEKRAADAKKAG